MTYLAVRWGGFVALMNQNTHWGTELARCLPLSTVRRGMAPQEATDDAMLLWSRCKRRDSGTNDPFQ